jgi:hypothetical protein
LLLHFLLNSVEKKEGILLLELIVFKMLNASLQLFHRLGTNLLKPLVLVKVAQVRKTDHHFGGAFDKVFRENIECYSVHVLVEINEG